MLELTVRLVVSLAIVIGLLLVLARIGGRRFRGSAAALVHVVHRQPLSRTSAVAVVTVGSRVLVLGTTEQQVSVLAELDPDELDLELDLDEAGDDAGSDHRLAGDVLTLPSSLELGVPGPAAPLSVVPDAPARRAPARRAPARRAPARRTTGSHRAAPSRPDATAAPTSGALAGSVLSAQTWKQAFAAAKGSSRRAS